MTKPKSVLLGILLLLVSLACVVTIPVPGGTKPDAKVVDDTPTAAVSATRTPVSSRTPVPPPTRRLSGTEEANIFPSSTPRQMLPTITLADVLEQVTGQPVETNRPHPPGSGVVWTPTPASWQCKAILRDPEYGKKFKPRDEFMAFWRVYNVGTAPWAKGEFVFEYVEGDKLHKPDYEPEALSYTVYVDDKYPFSVRLFAPKEPGRYTTTWGLRRVNKKEPFCTFTVTINVVKK